MDSSIPAALSGTTPEVADAATTSRSVDAYLAREYPALFPATADAEPTEAACRLPGCDGYFHDDALCEISLDSLGVVVGELEVTVNAHADRAAELAVWNDSGDLLRTNDRGAGIAFATRIREFADAIEKGADLLAPPAPVAAPEPIDYAARFAALDEYRLFALEGDNEDCTASADYVKSLLLVLADWRPRVVALLADAPAWLVPEVGAYEAAVARTLEAWALYSFRYEGGPDLPETFAVSPQVARLRGAPNQPIARIVSAGRRTLTVRGVAA